MALVDVAGTPLTQIGAPTRQGAYLIVSGGTAATLDAANEAIIMVGQIWTTDGGSHTIDTTGSSSLGWRTSSIVFANGATSVKVGLAAVDSGVGPPARAVNSAGTITFDVSRTIAGGSGGITSAAWNETVPNAGSKTIANGDLVAFAVQMTARGASDIINVFAIGQALANVGLPCVTSYLSSAYATTTTMPCARITFNDGARGYFVGGCLQDGNMNFITWNSGSATKEYGNYLKLGFPFKMHGLVAHMQALANFDFVVYSNPFGTPIAEKTVPILATQMGTTGSTTLQIVFPTPLLVAPNQELVMSFKPGGSNIAGFSRSLAVASDQDADNGGGSCYAVSRASGAFSAVNSQKDRFMIGALINAFAHPVASRFVLGA